MRVEEIKNGLKQFLEDKEHLDVSGNSLLVYHKGQEIFRHYTGDVTEDTIFRIYSMTKIITVTAALQLLELGKYTLEDEVAMYLPEYANLTVWDEETKQSYPAKNKMRVRDLFCMTAGLTYEGDYAHTPKQLLNIREEMEAQFPGESFSTLSYIRRLPEADLAFEPGTRWQYSLCHDVLGGLIEIWSGQTLGEYMREHIFKPLGMEHTFFRCPAELMEKMAGHGASGKEDAKFGPQAHYESGGGGLLSTLDDYMKFALCLSNGGTTKDGIKILGRKTVELMALDQLNDALKQDFNWGYLKGYSYGLGVRTMIDPALSGIPGTKGEFGWCGVLGTWVLIDPKEELAAVYMHQRYPNLEEYVQLHLRPFIYSLI